MGNLKLNFKSILLGGTLFGSGGHVPSVPLGLTPLPAAAEH